MPSAFTGRFLRGADLERSVCLFDAVHQPSGLDLHCNLITGNHASGHGCTESNDFFTGKHSSFRSVCHGGIHCGAPNRHRRIKISVFDCEADDAEPCRTEDEA